MDQPTECLPRRGPQSVPDWDTEEVDHELQGLLASVNQPKKQTQNSMIMPTMLQVDLELSDSSQTLDEGSAKTELTVQLIRPGRMSPGD